ncbi:MAG TPA: hypothetical protein VLA88_06570 [Candidatus Saccharimonadales bacterium]|nr:hypothetical protein [Candidatus Saccharimonadales bacterium]
MEHAAHMVDILNEEGKVVGQKHRREINKNDDIYHVIFVLLITPKGELVLSVIPPREDLPNLYARQMGTTVATIRRSDETALEAGRRCVERELFIDKADLHFLGEQTIDLTGSSRKFMSAYYLVGEPPATFSVIDIDTLVVVTPQQLRGLLISHADEVAPTLKVFWESYHTQLPI